MRALKALTFAIACALAPPAAAQAGDETLLLDFCVNARCVGVATVVVRDGAVLVDREALVASGLDVAALPGERIGEREFVDLAAINHGSTHTLDRDNLRLDLQLSARHLPQQHADLRQHAAGDAAESAPAALPWSAFANYAVGLGDDEARTAYVDGAVGRGHAAFRGSGGWNEMQGWQRGLWRFELDQPSRLRRWTVGDQYAVARDPLGGGRLLGGFGVERAFEQDPYLVTFPQPFHAGVLETPATVEVYANGVLVGRRSLDAGPYRLEHLGVPPGRSDLEVVVRDPFGNRSTLDVGSYYGSSGLLAPGLTDYAVRVGLPREQAGGDRYGSDPAVQAWVRRGVSDVLSLGARVEADRLLRNIGIDAALRLPLGELGLAWAGSDDDLAGGGHAHAISYAYSGRTWSTAWGRRRRDAGYRVLGSADAFLAPVRAEDYATLSWSPAGALLLQVNGGRLRRDGEARERTAGFSASWRMSPRTQLLASLQQRETEAQRDRSALLSFTYTFGRNLVGVSARDDEGDGGDSRGFGLDARRARPSGSGWGYDLSLDGGDQRRGFAQLEYQGRHARYALTANDDAAGTRGRLLVSGALVAIGGRGFATPPLETGFALVRVPGLAGLPILRENLDVGRTDARGDLLVRGLLPYYPVRIGLAPDAVPVGYDIRVPRRAVAVARNAGALVELDVAAVRAVTGRLAWPVTEGSALRIGEAAYPLGNEGRFYLDGLAPGRHEIEVDGGGTTGRCVIEVPASVPPGGIADLGSVTCSESVR